MSIKLTLKQISIAVNSGAVEKAQTAIPPGAPRFVAAKLLGLLYAQVEEMNKQQSELFKVHGVPGKDDKGNACYTLAGCPMENVEGHREAMTALLSLEVSIEAEPLSYAAMDPKKRDELSANDICALGPLLTE
jgi:hypothetical protein